MLIRETRRPADIALSDDDAKRHRGTQKFRDLTASVAAHGVLQAPGLTRLGHTLWGRGRILAAIEAGLAEIEVIVVDRDVTEAEAALLTLSENNARHGFRLPQLMSLVVRAKELNDQLRQKELAAKIGLGETELSKLLKVAACPIAAEAVRAGKLKSLEMAYEIAKAAADQKDGLLALRLSGSTKPPPKARPPHDCKPARVRLPVSGDARLVITAPVEDCSDLVELLQGALELARKAVREHLSLASAQKVWADRAKAAV